jgi:ubiquinone/menaquinone biosynthesis C-methylase UbiE
MLKLADNPDTDYKALVRRGYDRCAADYAGQRQDTVPPKLSLLIERLPRGAAVLDIGCGAGVPVCRELAKIANVTGVDLSPMMISLARVNVPSARFILADIMCAEFPAASLDAVTSFYAIFHLPKTEHEELFRRVYRWLKPGGQFLTTLSLQDEEPYTEDHFFGGTMYWSNYGLAQYREKLHNLGFTIEEDTQIGSGYGKPVGRDDEVHPLIFARKAR